MKKRWWVVIVGVGLWWVGAWWHAAHGVKVSVESEMKMVAVEKGEVKKLSDRVGEDLGE